MGNIILLNEETINKIAAGEVIERPASIVKELVENSIDAGSTSITIEIKDCGKSLISVVDNGCGIMEDDLYNVFQRHATSKINSIDDLLKIKTLGFRGEAMSSIAAVSEIGLSTRSENENVGSYILVRGGTIIDNKTIGYPSGTSIKVKKLFYNTPARLKFLKSDKTENSYISDVVEKIALCNTDISFKYVSDEKTIFHTPGNGDLLSVIQCIYGMKTVKMMLPVKFSNELVSIEGYIAKPEFSKGNSSYIIFSINNRIVKNIALKEAVRTAYKSLLMNKRYPFSILNINISPDKIDVNVHPTKAEVKFSDDKSIFSIIYYAVNNVLSKSELQYTESFARDNFNILKEEEQKGEINYAQHSMLPIFDSRIASSNIDKKYDESNLGLAENHKITSKYFDNRFREMDINSNKSAPKLIIGQLFNTYILCQDEDIFYLVDQHAAHERILYENLINKKMKNDIESQSLLIPLIIELTPKEINYINTYIDMLNTIGFDIEMFGDNSIAIRQVPIIMGQPCSGAVLSDLLDTMENFKDNLKLLEEKTLLQIACKSAIKAGDNLNNKEMIELIDELFKTELSYTCPHGRPTIISLNKYDLEKKFKRIL